MADWNDELRNLSANLNVDVEALIAEIRRLLPEESITEYDLYDLIARTTASHTLRHHDYGLLGGRMFDRWLQRSVALTFSANANDCLSTRMRTEVLLLLRRRCSHCHKPRNRGAIVPRRDYDLTYFGLRTMFRSYFLRDRNTGDVLETPQFL